jgi:hypothetical protein
MQNNGNDTDVFKGNQTAKVESNLEWYNINIALSEAFKRYSMNFMCKVHQMQWRALLLQPPFNRKTRILTLCLFTLSFQWFHPHFAWFLLYHNQLKLVQWKIGNFTLQKFSGHLKIDRNWRSKMVPEWIRNQHIKMCQQLTRTPNYYFVTLFSAGWHD